MLFRIAILWLLNAPWARGWIARWWRPTRVLLWHPATQAEALHHGARRHPDACRWTPRILGLAHQQGVRSVVVGIGATPSDLQASWHHQRLADTLQQTRQLAASLGAGELACSGELPDLLAARGLAAADREATLTAQALYQASLQLLRQQAGKLNGVVLLGGASRAGRQLRHKLQWTEAIGPEAVLCLESGAAMPLQGRYLVVQCAPPGMLERAVASIPPGSVVLNAALPAPRLRVRRLLAERSVALVQLVGVQGRCWPQLPEDSRGAVPCAAAAEGMPLQVVTRCLNEVPLAPTGAGPQRAWPRATRPQAPLHRRANVQV